MKKGKIVISDLTDRIVLHRVVGTPFNEGNIACIAMNDGLIFIDSGRKKSLATEFRNQMEKRFNLPSKLLILSHTHSDHIFGMEAFKDIPVIMAEEGKKAFNEMHQDGLDTAEGRKKQLDEISKVIINQKGSLTEEWVNDYVPNQIQSNWFDPQILVRDKMSIWDGEHELEFVVCGGHSPCSAFIYDKTSKILFTGDNLNSEHSDSGPCMLYRAYLGIELMQKWLEMDVSQFAPGHGRVVDKEYLKISLDYFIELKKSLKQLKIDSIPEDEIYSHVSLPPFFEETMPDFMNQVLSRWYQEISV